MYGNKRRKLFTRIIKHSEVSINEFHLFSFPCLSIVFITWCSLFISKLAIILFRDGISTYPYFTYVEAGIPIQNMLLQRNVRLNSVNTAR